MNISRLRLNAAANVVGWVLPSIIFLALTPIMINKLGVEIFGVVTLIQLTTGYMNILNFGFSESLVQKISVYSDSEPDKAVLVQWVGLGLFGLFGLLGLVILVVISEWLCRSVLDIPESLVAESITGFRIGGAIFLLNMFGEYYRGCALGANRFEIPNLSRIIRIAVSAGAILLVLSWGAGVVEVVLATLSGLVVGLVINAVWMQKVMPLRPVGGNYREVLSEIVHFSKHIFFTRISSIVSGKLSQFILGSVSSVSNVSLYEVPTRAAEAGSVVLSKGLQIFYPEFSRMVGAKDLDRVKKVFLTVFALQVLVTTPLLMLVIFEGHSIIALWINDTFAAETAWIVKVVAVAYYLSALTNLPTFISMSFNQPQLLSKYSLIRMAITLVSVYPLVKGFGLNGAAVCLLLASFQGIFFMYESIKRALDINLYRVSSKLFVVAGLTCLVMFGLHEWIPCEPGTPEVVLSTSLCMGQALVLFFFGIESGHRAWFKKAVQVWK